MLTAPAMCSWTNSSGVRTSMIWTLGEAMIPANSATPTADSRPAVRQPGQAPAPAAGSAEQPATAAGRARPRAQVVRARIRGTFHTPRVFNGQTFVVRSWCPTFAWSMIFREPDQGNSLPPRLSCPCGMSGRIFDEDFGAPPTLISKYLKPPSPAHRLGSATSPARPARERG